MAKISDSEIILGRMLSKNSSQHNKASEYCSELKKAIEQLEKDRFDDWVESVRQDEILSRASSHTENSVLQFFFKAGKLFVNYDDHLISLIRDVRQLVALGFSLPVEIKKASDIAQKFYHKSIALKQIAHFYNTIDTQMLPFQQPMMLGLAVQFEKLIKDTGEKDDKYLSQLQDTADKLTSQNRHLRKLHDTIIDVIQSLMSTDLIKNQTKWKEAIDSIRSMILSIQERGISMDNTVSWRNHLDVQIYKAFQYQFKLGLENLHSNLSEIKVDLVYKNQTLQFRPPFEEIRAKYYREIKKFINLSTGFKPLGETTLFANLINNCSASMSNIYSRSERLFEDLAKVVDLFEEWVVLGSVDLEKWVFENLKSIADWELNLKILKQKGKEAETIPPIIKLDCISISTAGLRSSIDDQLQDLFDSIISAIKNSISSKLSKIEEFISKATEVLSFKAKSMEDITLAAQKQKALIVEKSFLVSEYEAAEADNKFLKSISGSGIDATAIQSQWSKLEIILESHEMMMTEQLDVLRNAFSGRISAFNSDLEKFTARWSQLKPKVDIIDNLNDALQSLDFIKEREVELLELEKVGRQLESDSQVFAVPTPEFTALIEVKNDIGLFREMWSLCESFVNDFNSLWEEDCN
jgi:dynein heavy chain 2